MIRAERVEKCRQKIFLKKCLTDLSALCYDNYADKQLSTNELTAKI
jgi:hypothetical protein